MGFFLRLVYVWRNRGATIQLHSAPVYVRVDAHMVHREAFMQNIHFFRNTRSNVQYVIFSFAVCILRYSISVRHVQFASVSIEIAP